MMTDAGFAVAQEPAWSTWRDTALTLYGEAHLLAGEVDRAVTIFVESSALTTTLGETDASVVSESELALIAMDREQWVDAAEHVDRAVATVDGNRMDDYPTSVLAFAGAARLAIHRGDAQDAERQLTRAMRARPACTFVLPWVAVRGRLHLAKAYWALGDRAAARHLLREIDDIELHRPDLGALAEEVARFRGSLSGADAGASSISATASSPLTPAELRVLPYLQTHLTIREIGERLFVSRNTINTEVSSIYRKLGVSSRSDAVERATTVGLLGA
jgi:LuxR family maltose regulon positive regulatory protein